MDLQSAPFGPGIGLVVVVDVAEQQAARLAMHDEPDVGGDAHRPEVPVSGPVQLVKAHAGVGRVDLQIEGGGFGRLLLVAVQPGKAIGEGVGNTKVHKVMRPSGAADIRPIGAHEFRSVIVA